MSWLLSILSRNASFRDKWNDKRIGLGAHNGILYDGGKKTTKKTCLLKAFSIQVWSLPQPLGTF